MMRTAIILAFAALLAGCGDGLSPAEKAARDTRAVAQVEAAQKRRPPPEPIDPQPFSARDLSLLPAGGQACRLLLRDRQGDDPMLAMGAQTAHLKLDGRIVTLAADHGSERFGAGIYAKYSGKTHWLETNLGADGAAAIAINDRYDRPIFQAAGDLRCEPARSVSQR